MAPGSRWGSDAPPSNWPVCIRSPSPTGSSASSTCLWTAGVAAREMSDGCRSLVHMFDEIRICGLGSITEAVLELHSGLTVLSGETGAGKSSVIRAFGLLAGGRADVAHIRAGSSSAAVEARL